MLPPFSQRSPPRGEPLAEGEEPLAVNRLTTTQPFRDFFPPHVVTFISDRSADFKFSETPTPFTRSQSAFFGAATGIPASRGLDDPPSARQKDCRGYPECRRPSARGPLPSGEPLAEGEEPLAGAPLRWRMPTGS